MLSNTRHHFEEEEIEYNSRIGVPQGSTLSPLLFNIYVDELLASLNSKLTSYIDQTPSKMNYPETVRCTLAYADDIAILCKDN